MVYSNKILIGKFVRRQWTEWMLSPKPSDVGRTSSSWTSFMPGMTGVEAARVLNRILPSVPILIVTLYITSQLVDQAKAAGIKGAGPNPTLLRSSMASRPYLTKETFFESKPIEPATESLL
jgi:hypothetical protein